MLPRTPLQHSEVTDGSGTDANSPVDHVRKFKFPFPLTPDGDIPQQNRGEFWEDDGDLYIIAKTKVWCVTIETLLSITKTKSSGNPEVLDAFLMSLNMHTYDGGADLLRQRNFPDHAEHGRAFMGRFVIYIRCGEMDVEHMLKTRNADALDEQVSQRRGFHILGDHLLPEKFAQFTLEELAPGDTYIAAGKTIFFVPRKRILDGSWSSDSSEFVKTFVGWLEGRQDRVGDNDIIPDVFQWDTSACVAGSGGSDVLRELLCWILDRHPRVTVRAFYEESRMTADVRPRVGFGQEAVIDAFSRLLLVTYHLSYFYDHSLWRNVRSYWTPYFEDRARAYRTWLRDPDGAAPEEPKYICFDVINACYTNEAWTENTLDPIKSVALLDAAFFVATPSFPGALEGSLYPGSTPFPGLWHVRSVTQYEEVKQSLCNFIEAAGGTVADRTGILWPALQAVLETGAAKAALLNIWRPSRVTAGEARSVIYALAAAYKAAAPKTIEVRNEKKDRMVEERIAPQSQTIPFMVVDGGMVKYPTNLHMGRFPVKFEDLMVDIENLNEKDWRDRLLQLGVPQR